MNLRVEQIPDSYIVDMQIDISADGDSSALALEIDAEGTGGYLKAAELSFSNGQAGLRTNIEFTKPGNYRTGIRLMSSNRVESQVFSDTKVTMKRPVAAGAFSGRAFTRPGVILKWSEVPYAKSYLLQISKTKAFTEILFQTETKETSYTAVDFLVSENYYCVRIKPLNPDIPSVFSEYYTFAITDPPMAHIPGGEFLMGKPDKEIGTKDEEPMHKVRLDPYMIDIHEVTVAGYCLFLNCQKDSAHYRKEMADSKTCGILYNDIEYYPVKGREMYPVVYVSYHNARAYAQWRGLSLPTEAEWELAAKGFEYRNYTFDVEILFKAPIGESNKKTVRVDSFPEGMSPFGLYHVCGNVWEWCLDYYSREYYKQNNINYDNPQGPVSGRTRILRGGAVGYEYFKSRLTYRDHDYPDSFSKYVGFRCAGTSPAGQNSR